MKKILVTGASGFIGNYVINELLKQNYIVIASSLSIEKAKSLPWFKMVKYISFNLKEFDNSINYFDFFDKPDAMIHLAWEGLPNYKSAFHTQENLPRHYSFLKNCVEHGMADITVTGTCFEYGMIEGCLTEEMNTKPDNAYAIAKDTLRKQLQVLQGTNKFTLKWVRLFYMYGAGQSPNSLLSQLDKALAQKESIFNMSGGEQQRDYLSVQKVAENIVFIAAQNKVTGIINCCSGVPITVKQLILDYLATTKQHIQLNVGYYPYADYEPMRFWGDDRKLKTIK